MCPFSHYFHGNIFDQLKNCLIVSYHYPMFADFTVELEAMQTGETCPIENLNMGKLSCPPAVGRGGVRS